MDEKRPPTTGVGAMMEMLESAERNRNYAIYHKAHYQAQIFGVGFIKIDPEGRPSNISIDDVYKHVEFVKEHRITDVEDPVPNEKD